MTGEYERRDITYVHSVISVAVITLALLFAAPYDASAETEARPLKIGIIGTGRIGGALARQVRDAGFDPVLIGSLERSRLFDLGQPLSNGSWTAKQMREALKSINGRDASATPLAHAAAILARRNPMN
jgi:hypothetical protein